MWRNCEVALNVQNGMFCSTPVTLNEATDVISGYISFCGDMVIPQKRVKVYLNNKPWISKSLNLS